MFMQKRVIHPYFPAGVVLVENWLHKMSRMGWQLINVKGWIFYFKKCQPKRRTYFMCNSLDKGKRGSDLFLNYSMAKEKYENKKNKIVASYFIFETDPKKIDKEYFCLKEIRNVYYRNYYLKVSLFWIVCFVGFVVLRHVRLFALDLVIPGIIGGFIAVPMLYSVISNLFVSICGRICIEDGSAYKDD